MRKSRDRTSRRLSKNPPKRTSLPPACAMRWPERADGPEVEAMVVVVVVVVVVEVVVVVTMKMAIIIIIRMKMMMLCIADRSWR